MQISYNLLRNYEILKLYVDYCNYQNALFNMYKTTDVEQMEL